MAKKSLLDSIDVPAPCPEKWDEMIGDDKVRLCQSCDRNIYNISEMTRGEARKLLFQSKEKVCIRLEKDRSGTVQTLKKRFHKITRQAPIAAGVLSASLTFSALTYAQGDAVIGTTSSTISNKHQDKVSAASISGTVSDSYGSLIPGATITLRGKKNKLTRSIKSNEDGFYEFKDVGKAVYKLEIKADGFVEFVRKNITVGNENLQLPVTLEVKNITVTVGIYELMPKSPARNIGLLSLKRSQSSYKQNNKTSQISFTIYDPNAEIVPNQTVELTNQKTKEKFTVSTGEQGVAQFSLIPHGLYDLSVSGNGFNNYRQAVQIKEAIEPNIKITLNVGMMVGDFIIDWSEIPTFQAIAQDDNETVKQQINSGFDVDMRDKSGETALHVAVQHGNLEIVRFLLDNGAKVSVKDKEKRETLAMVFDSFEDDETRVSEIIRLLVSKGADINVRDDDDGKQTLLMKAAEDDSIEGVKFLLELGANPNLKDEDGETALRKTDSDEIRQLLKRYGARE